MKIKLFKIHVKAANPNSYAHCVGAFAVLLWVATVGLCGNISFLLQCHQKYIPEAKDNGKYVT